MPMQMNKAKYLSIAEALKSAILSGAYESHERFPGEDAAARRGS